MITITYADACPSCPPGIPDASPHIGDPLETPAGTVTDHECSLCGCAWTALRRSGWVISRMLAPVAEARDSRLPGWTSPGEAA